LTPDQARAVGFGALVDDLIGIFGDGLDLDRDWLGILLLLSDMTSQTIGTSTHIVAELDAGTLSLLAISQVDALSRQCLK
jgi:hypothetical protein